MHVLYENIRQYTSKGFLVCMCVLDVQVGAQTVYSSRARGGYCQRAAAVLGAPRPRTVCRALLCASGWQPTMTDANGAIQFDVSAPNNNNSPHFSRSLLLPHRGGVRPARRCLTVAPPRRPRQDCYNIRLLEPSEFEMAEKLKEECKDFLESESAPPLSVPLCGVRGCSRTRPIARSPGEGNGHRKGPRDAARGRQRGVCGSRQRAVRGRG